MIALDRRGHGHFVLRRRGAGINPTLDGCDFGVAWPRPAFGRHFRQFLFAQKGMDKGTVLRLALKDDEPAIVPLARGRRGIEPKSGLLLCGTMAIDAIL